MVRGSSRSYKFALAAVAIDARATSIYKTAVRFFIFRIGMLRGAVFQSREY